MTSAIIVAAGSSRRMGFNKLLAPLAGVPVLRRTLAAFQDCAAIDEIIVVCSDEAASAVNAWKAEGGLSKLSAVTAGGAERHFSVWNGLQCASPQSEIVAVHDGGRPLVSPEQIARCIDQAAKVGAVTCARKVTETLKRADAEGRITGSIDRSDVWIMETPQVFRRDLLVSAYEAVMRDGAQVTDEVSALQHCGMDVHVVENTRPNPKITFPADLELAEKLLA